MAQLKSTVVQGALTVTGNVVANKLIKLGGTSDQILMADGSTSNKSDLTALINAAVTIKGTLGTEGTITSLSAASASNLGYGYKVITAGTYNNVDAKIGDMFICYKTTSGTYEWMHIPSGDDIEDTWRPINLEGTQILANGNTTKALNFKAGTNIGISNSDGTLTFTATDTGATAITTSGSGNAVTGGSYDASNRTITLTKGNSFLPLAGGTLTGTLGFKSNYIIKPVADYRCSDGSKTGAITITLPAGIGNTMVSLWIDVYNYVTDTLFSVHVGGYTYSNSTWTHNPSVMVYGADHKIRLGHNGTNFVIYIGELNSSWSYPQISVRDVVLGHNPTYSNWYKDWTISFTTSTFSNVTATKTDKVWTTKNLDPSDFQTSGSYVTLDTAQTISGKKTFSGGIAITSADQNTNMIYFLGIDAFASGGAVKWTNKSDIKLPYSQITGTPTIPTVNNGTLTIQKNGADVATFTANQSGNTTANITVPNPTDYYWANIKVASSSSTATTPSVQKIGITGSTTTTASAAVTMEYDSTYKALKFVFV